MQCYRKCARNSRSGNTDRKVLLTTTETLLHTKSVCTFLLETYGSGLVSMRLRRSERSVGSNVELLDTFARTRCMMT